MNAYIHKRRFCVKYLTLEWRKKKYKKLSPPPKKYTNSRHSLNHQKIHFLFLKIAWELYVEEWNPATLTNLVIKRKQSRLVSIAVTLLAVDDECQPWRRFGVFSISLVFSVILLLRIEICRYWDDITNNTN